MNAVSELDTAVGQELLRARLLGRARPRLVERYEIESVLGRGATGLVVAARDLDLGRDVALKLTPIEAGGVELGEAKSQASLEHPNVALLYDARVVDAAFSGRQFRVRLLSMQRVDGPNLRVWLREERRTPEQILAVFLGAGAGLAAAHTRKIVHRDFKPENVLVSSGGVAKVVDFGFALTASSTRSADEGRPSGVAGTDAYMAPEARSGRASTRSDQYSFGMSFAEALTGSLARPTGRAPAGVAPDVWDAVVRATSDAAADRVPSMTDLLDALRAAAPRPAAPSTTPRGASSSVADDEPAPARSRWRLAAALVAVTGGMVMVLTAQRADVSRMLARLSAPADDAPVPSAPVVPARAAALVDTGVVLEVVDAGPPPITCPTVPPEIAFHTTSASGRVRYGCYRMTITPDPARACAFAATVEKLGSGPTFDPCPRPSGGAIRDEDVRFAISSDGSATIDVELETASPPRDYRFSVRFLGDTLRGTFLQWPHEARREGPTSDDGDVTGGAT